MGGPPARRRDPLRSLGQLGATTLGDRSVGGGHDGLLGDQIRKGGKGWSPKARYRLVDLLDVDIDYDDEDTAPSPGDVPTWDPTALGEDGGAWVAAPGGGGGLKELFEDSDSGSFDEGTRSFTFSADVPTDPGFQLVQVNAYITSDSGLLVPVDGNPANGTVPMPTPLVLVATDDGGDPVRQSCSGNGGAAQVTLWAHNDTSEQATRTIQSSVDAAAFDLTWTFDVTVTITIRSLYTPTV